MPQYTEGEVGEEQLMHVAEPGEPSKIPEWNVPYCEHEIGVRCKSAQQRAAAEKALAERDFDAYTFIVISGNWQDDHPIGHDEVADYGAKIDQIQNQDTRERAYQALHERDRARLENLLNEND